MAVNHWQPMIDRCNEMDRRINDVLARRVSMQGTADFERVTLMSTDDLETVLFAVRYAANSLGSMKMGASQASIIDTRNDTSQRNNKSNQ